VLMMGVCRWTAKSRVTKHLSSDALCTTLFHTLYWLPLRLLPLLRLIIRASPLFLGMLSLSSRLKGVKHGAFALPPTRGRCSVISTFRPSGTRSLCTPALMSSEQLLSMRPSLKARSKRVIEESSLIDFETYAKARRSVYYPLRRLLKTHRQLMLGPYASVTFESYDLMWLQTQEMWFVERGEVSEELDAYNALVPNGHNLVVTLMFEIENPVRRDQILHTLGHVEDTLSLSLAGNFIIPATSVDGHDVERTSEYGKTSAVHFLKFNFDEQQRQTLLRMAREGGSQFELAFSHVNYSHSTKLPHATLQEISNDLL